MKKILIIAGPNGAGKTTFATEVLPKEARCLEFVNADLIAAGLSPFQPEQLAFAAGRLMLQRIATLVAGGKSFAFETTLASHNYLRSIPQWRAAGYQVKLWFFKLPDAGFAIRRVEQRVRLGGHHIPPHTVQRRFDCGLTNLREHYIAAVDEWAIYDGSQQPPLLLESGTNSVPPTLMEDPAPYSSEDKEHDSASVFTDPDFIGAEAAMKRASAKAVAQARAAGLEPVVWDPAVDGPGLVPTKEQA